MYPPLCVRAGGESECALDSVCESGRLVSECALHYVCASWRLVSQEACPLLCVSVCVSERDRVRVSV